VTCFRPQDLFSLVGAGPVGVWLGLFRGLLTTAALLLRRSTLQLRLGRLRCSR
jgi:hypothetical protein